MVLRAQPTTLSSFLFVSHRTCHGTSEKTNRTTRRNKMRPVGSLRIGCGMFGNDCVRFARCVVVGRIKSRRYDDESNRLGRHHATFWTRHQPNEVFCRSVFAFCKSAYKNACLASSPPLRSTHTANTSHLNRSQSPRPRWRAFRFNCDSMKRQYLVNSGHNNHA